MAKICLIDSEASSRTLVKNILIPQGQEIFSFDTVRHVIRDEEFVKKSEFDLILFDLAGVSAKDVVLQTLDLKHHFKDIPILLLVDSTFIPQAIEALRVGAFSYCVKPLMPSDLCSFVNLTMQSRNPGTTDVLFQDFPTLEELEKRYMKVVLEKTRGRKERAAKILGINRRTLYRKEREYGWVSEEEAAETGAELKELD